MFVRRKKYPSGNTGVIVVEKYKGQYKELITIGIGGSTEEVEKLVAEGKAWIAQEEKRRHPQLDLFGEEREACEKEIQDVNRFLSNVTNILINGSDLILDRVFDSIGFNKIEDDIFRKLVKARLSYPASKAATVEYLKNHFDDDVDLSRIYRYLDKLADNQHNIVQEISVKHTLELFGGNIGILFYDVTTLYFETDYEDDLRKRGFSKEGILVLDFSDRIQDINRSAKKYLGLEQNNLIGADFKVLNFKAKPFRDIVLNRELKHTVEIQEGDITTHYIVEKYEIAGYSGSRLVVFRDYSEDVRRE